MMKTVTLDIQTPDGICDAFAAYPSDGGSFPAVLLYMDAFGVRPYLKEMAQTLAAEGYYVLLPNLFYRSKRAPVVDAKFPLKVEDLPEIRKQILPLAKSYDPEMATQDAGAFLDFLGKQKQVRPSKIALSGYCMGGAVAIRTAAAYPDRVALAASFHAGNLATDAPESPHRLLGRIRAELYIAHADNDPSMPPEQMERLRAALKESGASYEVELYTGAAHGFTMADLPAYNEGALKKHWDRLLELLKQERS